MEWIIFGEKNDTLLSAVYSNNVSRVRELIAAGVNVNQKGTLGGFSPLMMSVIKKHDECTQLLVDAGCDLSEKFLLYNAVGNPFALKLLLPRVKITTNVSRHPLFRAIMLGDIESAKLLIHTWDWICFSHIAIDIIDYNKSACSELVLEQCSARAIMLHANKTPTSSRVLFKKTCTLPPAIMRDIIDISTYLK